MVDLASMSFSESVVDGIWICAGILISVVLPVLSAYVRAAFGTTTAAAINFKKYLALLAFSAITALLILAIYRADKPDEQIAWYAALLAGYGWEATLEKLAFGPKV